MHVHVCVFILLKITSISNINNTNPENEFFMCKIEKDYPACEAEIRLIEPGLISYGGTLFATPQYADRNRSKYASTYYEKGNGYKKYIIQLMPFPFHIKTR